MKNSWTRTFRRLAAACAIGGATMFSSAMTYAATIAFDTATDPSYDDGWQAGDNGGFGFGPWNFDNGYTAADEETMDIFSHPNDLGRAWTVFKPTPEDLGRAGRAIPGGLQAGDTLHIVIDNPTERQFFKGYTVKLTNGSANMCYSGDNCTTPDYDPFSITKRMRIGTFEYGTNGQWYVEDNGPSASHGTTLFDVDTNHGMRIDLTVTGADTYQLKMTPLNNPGIAYSRTGTFSNVGGGPITWVEFEHYNTQSDYYPAPSIVGGDTDLYISNVWITKIPEPTSLALVGLGAGVLLASAAGRRRVD
jgi:hypothetical protein